MTIWFAGIPLTDQYWYRSKLQLFIPPNLSITTHSNSTQPFLPLLGVDSPLLNCSLEIDDFLEEGENMVDNAGDCVGKIHDSILNVLKVMGRARTPRDNTPQS